MSGDMILPSPTVIPKRPLPGDTHRNDDMPLRLGLADAIPYSSVVMKALQSRTANGY